MLWWGSPALLDQSLWIYSPFVVVVGDQLSLKTKKNLSTIEKLCKDFSQHLGEFALKW